MRSLNIQCLYFDVVLKSCIMSWGTPKHLDFWSRTAMCHPCFCQRKQHCTRSIPCHQWTGYRQIRDLPVHPRCQSWITIRNIERVTDRQTNGLTDRQTSYIFFVQERRPNCKELLVGNMAKQSFVQIQSLELKSLFSL